MSATAMALSDDRRFSESVQRVAVDQARRDRRAKRLENRWASFEVGFGTGTDYATVARMLHGWVGHVISVTARGGIGPVDVVLLDSGLESLTGAITIGEVDEHGERRPTRAIIVPYEELLDVQVF